MPPQRFYTYPSTGAVGVSQTISYDATDAIPPIRVKVRYNPDLGGFSTSGETEITVVPPPGCTSVTLEDMDGQSQDFTLSVT